MFGPKAKETPGEAILLQKRAPEKSFQSHRKMGTASRLSAAACLEWSCQA